MDLVYFVLCAFGLTNILAYGSIFNKIRPKHSFFHCPMCIGFWVGVFLWLINPYTELINFDNSFVTAFLCGCAASGATYIMNMLFDDEGIRIKFS